MLFWVNKSICALQAFLRYFVGTDNDKKTTYGTHLEPLDGVRLGDLVLVANLRALRLTLRHAVSRAVEYDVKVHPVDTWAGAR